MSEKHVQASVFAALGNRPDIRIFRNTCGVGWIGQFAEQSGPLTVLRNARRTTFGLHPGSADLIGWQSVVVTPDMVGDTVGLFLSVEIKKPGGRIDPKQLQWMQVVQRFGGVAGIVNSIEAAGELVGGAR